MQTTRRNLVPLGAIVAVLFAIGWAAPSHASGPELPTHGDPVRPFEREAARAQGGTFGFGASADGLATTGCSTELSADDTANAATEGPQIKLVYARSPDASMTYAARRDLLQRTAARISEIVVDASGGGLDLRWDTGTACGPDTVDITSITLPHPAAYYDALDDSRMFQAIGTDVTGALGWDPKESAFSLDDSPLRDLVVFVDGLKNRPAFGGIGTLSADDSKRYDNANNRGNGLAEVFPSAYNGNADVFAEIVLHEISHTLGAVGDRAPNSTGAGHCVDEVDVMCYADGGPRNTVFDRCGPSAVFFSRYDCGGDDYFNVAPQPGSHLATRWNVADSIFLCVPARCRAHHPPPAVSLTLPARPVEEGDLVTLVAETPPTDAPVLHYVWDFDGDGAPDPGAAGATVSHAWGSPGARSVRVRAFNSDGLYGDASAVVTVNALPQPAFTASASVAGQPTRLQARTNATHGGLDHWAWSFGDGTPPVIAAQDEVAHTFASPGSYAVTLTATYADGTIKDHREEIDVAPQPPAPTATPARRHRPSPRHHPPRHGRRRPPGACRSPRSRPFSPRGDCCGAESSSGSRSAPSVRSLPRCDAARPAWQPARRRCPPASHEGCGCERRHPVAGCSVASPADAARSSRPPAPCAPPGLCG